MGMPRRYYDYSHMPEFQILNVLSTAGATVLGVGYLLPMVYFLWSMRYGKPASDNPWNAAGLEWKTTSPPPTFNFDEEPIVTWEAYNYENWTHPTKARLTKRGCLLQNNSDSTVAVHERHGEAHAAHNPAFAPSLRHRGAAA